jgi:hypothetical protein
MDDQAEFSKFLHDPFADETANLSAAPKRVNQAVFDGGEDQSLPVSPKKRPRRKRSSTFEEPVDNFVNSMLRGNTAPRTFKRRSPRRF